MDMHVFKLHTHNASLREFIEFITQNNVSIIDIDLFI